MKILQVYQIFNPEVASGAARVAYDVSKSLARRGHKVVFYASDMKDKLTRGASDCTVVDGIEIHRFRTAGKILPRNLKFYVTPQLVDICSDEIEKFDIIHLHGYRSFQSVIVHHFAKKYNIPYVLQAHGSLPRIMAKQTLKRIYDVFFGYRLLKDASKVIALSPVEVRQYKSIGISEEKIAIIPNGIDLLRYTNLPSKGRFKERYSIEKGKKVVLYLGRINQFKGIDFLIDAFAYLIKNMEYKNAVLVIAGPNDGYLDAAHKLIKKHRIENKVLLTGPLFGINKVKAYVDASIVASLDSLNEVVFLLVPLEAAACGTSVIVTKSNYIATLVEKGKFGCCVEYGNVPKLAHMLGDMLSNKSLLTEMGLNGRNFVFENFNWDKIVGTIEEVYEDVVEGRDNVS